MCVIPMFSIFFFSRKGRRILVFFANNWDHTRYTLEIIYKSLILTLDNLLLDTQNQMNGLIFIVDWGNLTLRQTSNNINSFKQVRTMLEGKNLLFYLFLNILLFKYKWIYLIFSLNL